MKIVLDFDDTIFDTYQLMQEFFKVFQKEGFIENQFWNTYRGCKKISGDFDKNLFIDLFYEIKAFDKEKINKEIDFIIERTREFIFSDFYDFVANFEKKDLILLSFGTTDFQKIKIKNSEIATYFREIIITNNDKTIDLENIFNKNKGEKIFLIDDKGEQINKIKEKMPQIITIKIERARGGHRNTKSKLTDYVVKNLYEVKDICKMGA